MRAAEASVAARALLDTQARDPDDRLVILRQADALLGMEAYAVFPLALFEALARDLPGPAARALHGRQLMMAGPGPDLRAHQVRAAAEADRSGGYILACLAALPPASPPAAETTEAAAARERWQRLGRPGTSFEAWAAGDRWAAGANLAVQRFLGPHRAGSNRLGEQIDALVAPLGTGPLEDALQAGRGVLLAAPHAGPMHALLTWLDLHRPGLRVVSGLARYRATGGQDDIYLRYDPQRGLREMVRTLRDNRILVAAADAPVTAEGRRRVETPAGPVLVHSAYARVQALTGAAGLWAEAAWEDGRVVPRLRPMPARRPEEPRDDFVDRWCRAYAGHLAELLRGRVTGPYRNQYDGLSF